MIATLTSILIITTIKMIDLVTDLSRDVTALLPLNLVAHLLTHQSIVIINFDDDDDDKDNNDDDDDDDGEKSDLLGHILANLSWHLVANVARHLGANLKNAK